MTQTRATWPAFAVFVCMECQQVNKLKYYHVKMSKTSTCFTLSLHPSKKIIIKIQVKVSNQTPSEQDFTQNQFLYKSHAQKTVTCHSSRRTFHTHITSPMAFISAVFVHYSLASVIIPRFKRSISIALTLSPLLVFSRSQPP